MFTRGSFRPGPGMACAGSSPTVDVCETAGSCHLEQVWASGPLTVTLAVSGFRSWCRPTPALLERVAGCQHGGSMHDTSSGAPELNVSSVRFIAP
ncbi:unnamed protein product [Lota lota]